VTVGASRRRLLIALLFLAPNLLGFVVFTAGPIVFSLAMSFTDWALTKHNALSGASIGWVGFENYRRVLAGDESHLFWDYFGNTAFLMLGIPIGIAGSLGLALMLSAQAKPGTRRGKFVTAGLAAAITVVAAGGVWLVTTPGIEPRSAAMSGETGLTDLSQWRVDSLRSQAAVLTTLGLGAMVTLGLAIGPVFFRTVFYLPSLLAGVAMFLLWKTLYKPRGGLINAGLEPVLASVQRAAESTPGWMWHASGVALVIGSAVWAIRSALTGLDRLRHGEAGVAALLGRFGLIVSMLTVGLGLGYALVMLPPRSLLASGYAPLERAALLEAAEEIAGNVGAGSREGLRSAAVGLGERSGVREAIAALTGAGERDATGGADVRLWVRRAVMARAAKVYEGFASGRGLVAPEWLIDARWAKTALIIMGVWAGLGGGTMLLYLAGLSNIPPELYEAAAIDGATGWRRFANVTWPQLAPTTFFIVIMSTIGGLQGGFEQAMVMTQGKADTITLAYYIYNIAFTDQFQLGLASAVAWVMFAMIFVVTALNFRLGSQLTNE